MFRHLPLICICLVLTLSCLALFINWIRHKQNNVYCRVRENTSTDRTNSYKIICVYKWFPTALPSLLRNCVRLIENLSFVVSFWIKAGSKIVKGLINFTIISVIENPLYNRKDYDYSVCRFWKYCQDSLVDPEPGMNRAFNVDFLLIKKSLKASDIGHRVARHMK